MLSIPFADSPSTDPNATDPAARSYQARLQFERDALALKAKIRHAMGHTDNIFSKALRPARVRMNYGSVVEIWNIDNAVNAILGGQGVLVAEETATLPTGRAEKR